LWTTVLDGLFRGRSEPRKPGEEHAETWSSREK
jgi:hypothetical protein